MALKLAAARRLWLLLHRCLALWLGFLLALLGLTGSLAIYGEELDHALNPRFAIGALPGQPLALDVLMTVVRQAHPELHGSWILELPRSPAAPLTVIFEKPPETAGKFYAPLMVSVNPYTAEILASRVWGKTARTWLLDWHTQLHLGGRGWKLVGLLGLALMVSLLSGLYLWWPGLAGLGSSLGIRHDAGLGRFALDAHRLIGLVSVPVLLILAFTGFNLAYPGVAETFLGVTGMSHGASGPAIRSTGQASAGRPVSIEEAVLLARGPFPRAEVSRITLPDGPEGTYQVVLRQYFESNDRHPMTAVWVDQYNGQIREVRNPARFNQAQKALTGLWPLHAGAGLSDGGRFLWCLAGVLLPVLYVTGLTRWLIGRGWVNDRALEVAAPWRAGATGWSHAIRTIRGLIRVSRPWLDTALGIIRPMIMARYGAIRLWLDGKRSGG